MAAIRPHRTGAGRNGQELKLLRYCSPGTEKPGVLDSSGRVRDLSGVFADITGDALGQGELRKHRSLDLETLPIVDGATQDDLRLGPCVGSVGKFICIGLNYADHAEEAGMHIPAEPIIFNKWTSAICGPKKGQCPHRLEVELGVVTERLASTLTKTTPGITSRASA